jgi:hypothetical protein
MGRERRRGRALASVVFIAGSIAAAPGLAYDGDLREKLTFLAARYVNACVEGDTVPRLEPLDVRYVARANVAEADAGWAGWFYRSDFYDRERQAEKSFLWVFDARIHERYREATDALAAAEDFPARYEALGRVVANLQDMTSPPHVVPVNFARWWRFSVADRFDSFPIDADAIELSLANACAELTEAPESGLEALLVETAEATLRAVQSPIPGFPASWQAFWTLADDPEDMGDYGRAGNTFGKRVDFDCYRVRCRLAEDDPIYRDFAFARHRSAVLATARAMLWHQRARMRPSTVDAGSG